MQYDLTQLNKILSDNIAKTKAGAMEPKMCETLANSLGKLLKSNMAQLQYNDLMDEKVEIFFFKNSKKALDSRKNRV